MNPLAFTKCAGRLLMALAAMTSILLIASCGSGGSPARPNNSGFGDSDLKGTYVLSVSGTDVNASAETESFFAIVGAITADGNGNITGGTVDINDLNLASPGVFLGQTVSGSYSISSDGRGTGTLVTPQGKFGLDFVLTSTGHGLITRFDPAGSGSGTLDVQGSATQTSLTSLAFSLSGVDYNVNSGSPLGTVGAFTLNTSTGGVTSGLQDFNDNGSSAESGSTGLNLATTSSLVLTSGTNGTAQLTTTSTFGTLAFDVWVIDSTHLKFIETDTATTGFVLSGDAFTQQTSFTAGQLVFTLGGLDSSGQPLGGGGYVTTDVNGNLSNGLEDFNDAGTANTLTGFKGSCTTFTAGRCQLAMTGFTNLGLAAYPSSGGVLLLEDDSNLLAISQGAAYAQTATSFAASEGYGLNLSGENTTGVVDVIAQFNAGSPGTTSTTTANVTGILDENDLTTPTSDIALNGIYVPDPTPDGRGSIAAPPPGGSLGTLIGALTLQYYVVDGSTILLLEVDADQVAVGTFQLQSAPGGGGSVKS
ncbi:MAG: hypothetical protein ABSA80_10800, partial [Terriglobales bacterium]